MELLNYLLDLDPDSHREGENIFIPTLSVCITQVITVYIMEIIKLIYYSLFMILRLDRTYLGI